MASIRSINSTPRDTPDFVQEDLTQYKCPVSFDILRDCVQLPCGHKVCAHCVDRLFPDSISDGQCPVNEEDCFPFQKNEILPDYGTRREILKLKVYCNFKKYGCNEEMEWSKHENHCSFCLYRLVDCSKKCEGCEEKMPFKDLDDHVLHFCLYSTISCDFCREPVLRKDIKEHHSYTCQNIEVSCKYNCDMSSMPRHLMLEHESTCTRKPSKCPYASAGCQFEGKEKDVREHEQKSIVEHMSLNQKYTKDMENQNREIQKELENIKSEKVVWQSQIVEMKNSYDGLINQVENMKKEYLEFQVRIISTIEKVFSMEELLQQVPTKQTTDELGRDLRSVKDNQESLNRKLTDLERGGFSSGSSGARGDSSSIGALKKQVENIERQTAIQDIRLAELDLRFQILETVSYNGVLIWKIMDYNRRKQDAMSGRTYSLFSQPFYTGRFGYKMCGRVYLNGDGMGKGTHMSLFFVIMKGEHDALMPWPFKQSINMALLDQQDGVNQVTDSFRPDTTSSSFQRPTTDMNTAVGCPLFVSHQKLETQKYVKDDSLFIKITVDKSGLPHH